MKKLDYKWVALILLWVAFFLQQGTRQLFGSLSSTVLPWIQNTLGQSTGLASLAGFYLLGALVVLLARVFFLSRDLERK